MPCLSPTRPPMLTLAVHHAINHPTANHHPPAMRRPCGRLNLRWRHAVLSKSPSGWKRGVGIIALAGMWEALGHHRDTR